MKELQAAVKSTILPSVSFREGRTMPSTNAQSRAATSAEALVVIKERVGDIVDAAESFLSRTPERERIYSACLRANTRESLHTNELSIAEQTKRAKAALGLWNL